MIAVRLVQPENANVPDVGDAVAELGLHPPEGSDNANSSKTRVASRRRWFVHVASRCTQRALALWVLPAASRRRMTAPAFILGGRQGPVCWRFRCEVDSSWPASFTAEESRSRRQDCRLLGPCNRVRPEQSLERLVPDAGNRQAI